MDVRENRWIAFVLTLGVALFVAYDFTFYRRAKAQESTDTEQSVSSSDQAASDLSGQPIEATDKSVTENKAKPSDESTRGSDPVFQEQTAPPPQATLAEKKSPLLERSEEKEASKQSETTQTPPPKPIEERRPPPPYVNYVWVPGFWYWYDVQYVWIPGRWMAPRPGYVFVRPRWARRAGVWVFLPGGWAVAGSTSILYPFEIGIFVRPWLRHHRYDKHRRHIARPHRRGRAFHRPMRRRPHARNTTRRATRPRSRARKHR